MKKLTALLLTLVLLLALWAPAAAAGDVIVPTTQALTVDGAAKTCEIYNINDSNYFKLRDIAYMLNGTGSQFEVGWDEATRTVTVTTGAKYTPNGSEMAVRTLSADQLAAAGKSPQTILVNGVARSDLGAYLIGDNNFFKLRDLGNALGFSVDYDTATRTMVVKSAGAGDTPAADIRVTDLYSLTGRVTAAAGYYDYYSFRLPKVSGADTAYIRMINAAVQEIYDEHVQTALDGLEEYGALLCSCVSYKYAVNGDIHSLLISADSDWGEDYYWCFNFDDAGNEVKNADVLKAAGQTEAGFVAAAKAFLTDYTDLSAYVDDDEFWKPLQEQTISPDNLNADIPMVLLPDGKLCFIATIFTPAGAGQYDYVMRFNSKNEIEMDFNFGVITLYRFEGTWLVDGADADGMRMFLDFFTIGDQLTMEVTAFDEEIGSVYYYYAADVSPVNAADMLRGDLESIQVKLVSYCPDVLGGSYYGDGVPGVYTVTFGDDALIFSGFAGGTEVIGKSFTARRAYRDELGLDSSVPGTDYDHFDFDVTDATKLPGIWTGSYVDLAGESHDLTLELTSWGELRLRDTSAAIPRVLAGSYYIAGADDDSGAPAGSVVFNVVSRAGYKMPNDGFCHMTVGSDGKLRVTDAFDSFGELTHAGVGVTVTLNRVPAHTKLS